ncbi:MAG: RibD family protein, partial [Flavipsychrobacter sp.]
NRRFFCFHQQHRPYIILKWAQTPDGHFAPVDKSRFQITGAESQALVHKWRTEEASIMVGFHTAVHDNPQLTARLWNGKQPLRIAFDRKIQMPHTHHLYNTDAPTWIINERLEAEEGHVHFVKLSFDDSLLPAVLQRLHEAKVLSLMVEGGAHLLGRFIDMGIWDEARVLTGQATLPADSIQAPVLSNATEAFTTEIGVDRLNVFINNKSAYKYVHGMEL